MSIELAPRMVFAILQVLFGLVVPAIYATSFTTFSLAAPGFYQAAYWLGLPTTSFLVLAWVSLKRRGEKFQVSRAGMWSSAFAGYLAFVIPATLLWFTTGANYRGGGANIGVALLVVAMPIYLPVFMIMGFGMGESLHGQKKHT